MERWIKLHNKLLEWEWFTDAYVLKAWIWMLMTANNKDKRWRGRVIKRGQFLTSIRHMAEALEMSDRTVQSILKKLQSTSEIKVESDRKLGTMITICKYDDYQVAVVDDTTLSTTPSTTPSTTLSTTNIRIEEKKKEEYISTTTTRTHVREFDTETKLDILRDLYQNETWIEDSSQLLMMDSGIVKELITKFALEIKTSDTDDSRNEAELFAHLKNYLRLSKRITSNGSNNSDRNDKRRGTLPTATSASEYSTTF